MFKICSQYSSEYWLNTKCPGGGHLLLGPQRLSPSKSTLVFFFHSVLSCWDCHSGASIGPKPGQWECCLLGMEHQGCGTGIWNGSLSSRGGALKGPWIPVWPLLLFFLTLVLRLLSQSIPSCLSNQSWLLLLATKG